ncbi:PREDICTED: rab3 GTPase-activating protein catalytic subunit-like, partial [Amphimedon queenslandica]
IQRQTSSEQQPLPQTPPSSTGYHKSTSSDSDEEFFEAQDTFEEHHKEDLRSSSVSSLDSKTKKLDLEPLVNIDPLSLFASESEDTDLFTGRGGGGGGKGRGEGVPIRIGALKPFKGLTLLKSNEQLYVPETQEQTPLTEDMLWEQQSVLSKLGTSEEAAQVRAKMQSMSLLSDMQAFKAANPGCVLEDFIRWYSPRDWIDSNDDDDDDEKSSDGLKPKENDPKGRLSIRMRQAGNMWVETWDNASPIPAYKQKRLFDDTKEAEKVLHWLSALKPAELVLMVLPCLVHSAVLHLKKELEEMALPSAWGYINDAINITKTIQWISLDSLPIYQECFGLLEKTEHDIATAASLHAKLKQGLDINTDSVKRTAAEDKELMASIQILVEEPELVLQDPVTSVTGLAFQGLLKTQIAFQSLDEVSPSRHSRQHQTKFTGAALPKATAREFILRTVSPQPSLLSSPAPQRMFCFLTKDETRVAGAFTQDVLIV